MIFPVAGGSDHVQSEQSAKGRGLDEDLQKDDTIDLPEEEVQPVKTLKAPDMPTQDDRQPQSHSPPV